MKGLEGRMQKKASLCGTLQFLAMKNKAVVGICVYRLLGKWPFL